MKGKTRAKAAHAPATSASKRHLLSHPHSPTHILAHTEHTESVHNNPLTTRALTSQYLSVLWFYSLQQQPVRLPARHWSLVLLVDPPLQQRPCCLRTRTASSSAWQQRRKMTSLPRLQYCSYTRSTCATHSPVGAKVSANKTQQSNKTIILPSMTVSTFLAILT